MAALNGLKPEKVFEYFEKLCSVPHGSGNTKIISDLCVGFAKELGLRYRQEACNNLIIWKDGSVGYEQSEPIILQGHIDMVCAKTDECAKDMAAEGLDLRTDGEWVWADQTSLGGDNGIAVAMILAILADDTLPHPPLEAVFTVDEEVGMDGAFVLDCSDLKGKKLLNLDSEEEGIFTVSCAGGMRADCTLPGKREPLGGESCYAVTLSGLQGGHSGGDIHLQRASANKLMGRLLDALQSKVAYSLVRVDGGKMDNAICREADAVLTMTADAAKEAEKIVAELEKEFKQEYHRVETDMIITWEKATEAVTEVMTEATKSHVISILLLIPYGVETMSMDIEGLVESSSNIGVVCTDEKGVHFDSAVRSAVASRKEVLCRKIETIAQLCGAAVESSNDYPGWVYSDDSKLLVLLQDAYRKATGREPKLTAIHAGVECGLFAEKMPWLDMVSLGPDMFDVHTPEERLSISSTMRTWDFLKEALKQMK